jgi:hypothetical protein
MTYATDDPRWIARELKLGLVLEMRRYIRPAPIT